MRVTWQLPFPPTVNTMYPTNKQGRRYLSTKGKSFVAQVQSITHPPIKLHGELSATLYMTPPDKRRRDLDNLFKAVFDSMQKCSIFEDDSQIKMITARMYEPEKNNPQGNCIVTLEEIG